MKKKAWMILALVVTGVLAVGIYGWQQQNAGRKQRLEEAQRVLQDKLTQRRALAEEKTRLYKQIEVDDQNPLGVLAYAVNDQTTMQQAMALHKRIGLAKLPVFALDSEMTPELCEEIVTMAEEAYGEGGYACYIFADLNSAQAVEQSEQLFLQLQRRLPSQSAFLYFKATKNIYDACREAKKIGCANFSHLTSYSVTIECGSYENMHYFEYVPVRSTYHRMKSSLELTVEQNKTVCVLFDMKALAALEEAEKVLEEVIDLLKQNPLYYCSVEEAVQYYYGADARREVRKAMYEAFCEENDPVIAALDREIAKQYNID